VIGGIGGGAWRKPAVLRGVVAAVVVCSAAAWVAGCSTLSGGLDTRAASPEEEAAAAKASAVLDRLKTANAGLKSFKGIGRLTVRREGKVEIDERVAWVGSDPLRLSVVLFASGFPAVRMASDGEWLYYQDHTDPAAPVKKIRSADPDLERILSVPIQASDIISLMCGRIPIREHRSARLLPLATGKGYVLLLSRIWGVHQKIFLDESMSEVRQTEIYDVSGSLVFQANFVEMQRIGGYTVPLRLVVQNTGEKALVQVVVERYWADVPVSPEMFQMASPG
jgi:hypothetical protein